MTPVDRCVCACHQAGLAKRADGVELSDPLEAAVACSQCERRHIYPFEQPLACAHCGRRLEKKSGIGGAMYLACPVCPTSSPSTPSWDDGAMDAD